MTCLRRLQLPTRLTAFRRCAKSSTHALLAPDPDTAQCRSDAVWLEVIVMTMGSRHLSRQQQLLDMYPQKAALDKLLQMQSIYSEVVFL